ncbi:MAG TPA: PEPxxWA-CTERM sorting domain-containing protein [Rubrivivax sp.]|nr:PEPxxWA-CTERM sorting domain-containing protein [Rubrivivax sp.]
MKTEAKAAMLLAPPPADAAVAYWGTLPTHDGSRIYQWHVADWIAHAFNDGDTTVSTSITMFFTQCFGGNWLASFNATPFEAQLYGLYDRWRFTEATVASADRAGDLSYYNGYHRSAAAAFSPYTSAAGVHDQGIFGACAQETPLIQGDADRRIGWSQLGLGNTFVLAYAGRPESLDWDDLRDIHDATRNRSGVSAVFLGGAGDASSAGMVGAELRAATASRLEATIFEIGAHLRAGSFDTFGFFATDHGGLATVDVAPAVLLPGALRRVVLRNTTGQTFEFDWIALSPGDVARPQGIPAIPEPGTWALMLCGLGVVGRLGRRRLREPSATP